MALIRGETPSGSKQNIKVTAEGSLITQSGASVGAVLGDQVLTVSTTAVALTVPEGAKFAHIEARCSLYVEEYTTPDLNVLLSEKVRYTLTGDDPSATDGYDLEDLDKVWLSEEYLADFKAIRGADNSSDATLYITYFDEA